MRAWAQCCRQCPPPTPCHRVAARQGGDAIPFAENPTDAQRPILADVMPGTTVCRVIRPRDLLHALGGVASLLPLLLLLTVPPAAEGSPAAEPPLSAADEALLMESSELHRGDTADRQGPSSPRASTAVLQSPHRDEKAMLQELCKVLAGRGPSFGVAPGFSLLEILEMVQVCSCHTWGGGVPVCA